MNTVRELDRSSRPTRFPRGWHCLGPERDFADGKPHAVEAFGGRLVVWADRQGRLNVVDGFCRHMGGDLSQGSVKGDEIACPFHDWRWGGDGRCRAIPYARRVPGRARTRSYPAVVRNGHLLVWQDAEGSDPELDQLPPVLEGIGTDAWTDWTWSALEVTNSHCREVVDNVVDMAHFFYVHFAFPTTFRNVFEGPTASQFMHSTGRPDKAGEGYGDESTILRSVATYYGPSYMVNWLTSEYHGFSTDVILINCHVPTSHTSFRLQFGLSVRKAEGVDEKTANYIARRFEQMFAQGFLQDVRIWQTKTKVDNPLLCEADGPVYQLRRWYEQFYVDRADVRPEMTDRFEFEVDTTRANENWHREVEENLAALRAGEQSPA